VRDFDISPDGREIVLEQVEEQSDIVLIDLSGGAPRNR
jgi:MinD-like ATPase involved in chromosome partitioning or flagellar assembly